MNFWPFYGQEHDSKNDKKCNFNPKSGLFGPKKLEIGEKIKKLIFKFCLECWVH